MREIAKITTNGREKVFNITRWRGVNEAPEGEAALLPGEAAVMRNFCVTSGGALKKRPGSRNVAGFLNEYTPRVREGSARCLLTETGAGGGLTLYPRVECDGVGAVQCAGESVTVTGENADAYKGYFYPRDGLCWALDRVERTGGVGGEAITGGTAAPGTLSQMASGTLNTGTGACEGTAYLDTWAEAVLDSAESGVLVAGETTRREAPARRSPGWDTREQGGWLLRDGRLWKYYGARVDACRPGAVWNKYQCAVAYDGAAAQYAPGAFLGTVTTLDKALPDSGRGYLSEGTFSYGGTVYTLMRQGGDYYCYEKTSAEPSFYEVSYSFHGIPMTVTANTYRWYFNETYAAPAETADSAVRGVWSGFVKGREVLCAACGGFLWELREQDGAWTRVSAGAMDTSRDVHMFGFDEKLYLLNGQKYLVWDGDRLSEVEGYRPLVAVAVPPSGGGTLLENVNRLTAGRRARFSPDGEAKTFQLPEGDIRSVDWVKDLTAPAAVIMSDQGGDGTVGRVAGDGDPYGEPAADVTAAAVPGYTVDLAAGTVTFETAPEKGVDTLEIAWSAREDYRGQVCGMRFAEIYNGAQDTRVFLYGDGSNRAIYSGLDHDGRPRADYFPDLYEVSVGDANTPLTAMIRHYNKLMAFKLDSAWSIGYDAITLVDGTVTAGFYVAPVNRAVGNCAWGQAQLVQNRPRTLDGRSVIEWQAAGASGVTGDQRNAQRVSQRVDSSIRRFDLTKARTFYDKFSHEYFVIGEDGTAIVQNLDVDAWYVYTGLEVTCMINYRDELYYGTRDGTLRHFSDSYFSDNGEAIDAVWESGAMSMGQDFRRKYSATVWIGIRPEDNGYLEVTAQTDRKSDFAVYDVQSLNAAGVPEMDRIKLKAKKFTYYKLILRNDTADKTATVVSADVRVREAGYVR